MDVRDEIILARRAVPQPTPEINPGGDCVACCFAGLLGLSVEEHYARIAALGEDYNPRSRPGMDRYLSELVQLSKLDHAVRATPTWPSRWSACDAPWGRTAWSQANEWWNYARALMAGGYYGLAHVNHAQRGPEESTDHLVLLVGARAYVEPLGEGGGVWRHEILVSCSSRTTPDEEWVGVREFLKRRGGFTARWARVPPVDAVAC